MYNATEVFANARRLGFSVQVQGDIAVVYGTHPARISNAMAGEGFHFAGHEADIVNLNGKTMTGVTYPVKG